jgi:hypothetical protein
MIPAFTDPDARRRWDAYFSEIDRLLARADADVVELRCDLEAHVVDSMAAASGGSEGNGSTQPCRASAGQSTICAHCSPTR